MVRYQVHLTGEKTVTLEATKVNSGHNWLWFFDTANHLVGMFYWKAILGFHVDGSAEGQIITDKIPMDMGTIPPEEISNRTIQEMEETIKRRKELDERLAELEQRDRQKKDKKG
jgi:hypothetical protein